MADADATFYYDVSSPYAYLAATRIGELLPDARWRPIAFPILLQRLGRVPWPLEPGNEEGKKERARRIQEEVGRRAAERGLPPVRWPEGFPVETWSFAPLRAGVFAEEHGLLEAFTLECFRLAFAEGRSLAELDNVLDAARAVGLDAGEVGESIAQPAVKEKLREYTDEAIDRGVTGVPTVAIGDELYWGDDRLDEAVAAVAG